MIGPAEKEFPNFASRTLESLSDQKQELKNRMDRLNKFFGDKISVAAFLAALGQGLPKSVSLDYVSIEDATGAVAAQSGAVQKRFEYPGDLLSWKC